jgi:geranylgeranyl transferase type-2 subunit alpha
LLTKRANKEYTWETLTQTEKFSFLSPDFSTLWNYRREIISSLFENELKEDTPKKLETIEKELKFLIKGIMKSPKSYTLWF